MDQAPLSYSKNHFTDSLCIQSASGSKGVSGQISTSFGFVCGVVCGLGTLKPIGPCSKKSLF